MKEKLRKALRALSPISAAQAAPSTGPAGLTTCPQPLDETLPDVGKMLQWDQEERLIGFRNTYRAYPGDVFHHGDAVSPLPVADEPLRDVRYPLDGHEYPLEEYIRRQSVRGLLVLKDGRILYKYLGDGNTDTTLWTSRSVGKSVVSILVGVAVREGKIRSLEDPLTVYKPDLAGTAWEGVTVRNLIQHTSGVEWNEDYADPDSDFAALTACEAHGEPYGCVRDLVYSVSRSDAGPGEVWSYNTGGAWLLGDVLETATGVPLAAYLEQKIWKPFGMARDGVWQAYIPGKRDMGGHGFNATLEDWGRFGLFVLGGGVLPDGTRLLPDSWIADSSAWSQAEKSVSEKHPEGTYGYQWWNNAVPATLAGRYPDLAPVSRDTMWAFGIYGQMLAVNFKENMVMVQWSTWKESGNPAFQLEAALLFASMALACKG